MFKTEVLYSTYYFSFDTYKYNCIAYIINLLDVQLEVVLEVVVVKEKVERIVCDTETKFVLLIIS